MVLIPVQLTIPRLLASERVLAKLPAWLKLVCTTRKDPLVLQEFSFPVPAVVEIDSHSSESEQDVLSYITQRVEHSATLKAALARFAAQELKAQTDNSTGLAAACNRLASK